MKFFLKFSQNFMSKLRLKKFSHRQLLWIYLRISQKQVLFLQGGQYSREYTSGKLESLNWNTNRLFVLTGMCHCFSYLSLIWNQIQRALFCTLIFYDTLHCFVQVDFMHWFSTSLQVDSWQVRSTKILVTKRFRIEDFNLAGKLCCSNWHLQLFYW